MSEPTKKQMKWNQKMCDLYPLGTVDAIWTILDNLWQQSSPAEKALIDNIMEATQNYDDAIRARLSKRFK